MLLAKHTNRSCVEQRTGYSHMRRRCLCSVCAAAAAPLCSLQKCWSVFCAEMLRWSPALSGHGLSALHIYRLAEGFRKCPGVPTGLSPLPPCCWCHWGQGDTWTWTHGHMDTWTEPHSARALQTQLQKRGAIAGLTPQSRFSSGVPGWALCLLYINKY